jgi:DNA-binding Lrp family transcriptional regulator
MPLAFVLISTEPEHMESVLEALKKIDAVEEAYMVYGVYDIVAKVKTSNMDTLREIVTRHMRRLGNVKSTITTIVMEEPK